MKNILMAFISLLFVENSYCAQNMLDDSTDSDVSCDKNNACSTSSESNLETDTSISYVFYKQTIKENHKIIEDKTKQIKYLHSILSSQAKDIEEKEDKIKELENKIINLEFINQAPYRETKYESAIKESIESYSKASSLLETNTLLEDELEKERNNFIQAQAENERIRILKQIHDTERLDELRRNDTTTNHLQEGSRQVIKETARVVHQAGNVGKRIIGRF